MHFFSAPRRANLLPYWYMRPISPPDQTFQYSMQPRRPSMAVRVISGATVFCLCLLGTGATSPSAFQGTACSDLAALSIPDVTVNAATSVAGGAFTPPGSQTALTTLPAFCR